MNKSTVSVVACVMLVALTAACQPVGLDKMSPDTATPVSPDAAVLPTATGVPGAAVVPTSMSLPPASSPLMAPTLSAALPTPGAAVEACYTTPIRGFGKVWAENPSARAYVGCPFATGEKAMNFLVQRFEHGAILWAMGLEYPAWARDQAYVLFADEGTFIRVPVDWEAQSPSPIPTRMDTPSEPFEPQGKLAEVWREGPGVKERLGLAIEAEIWGTGAWQEFSRGWMFWLPYRQSTPDDALGKSFEERDRWIYVLATYWPDPPGAVRNEWIQFLDTWE